MIAGLGDGRQPPWTGAWRSQYAMTDTLTRVNAANAQKLMTDVDVAPSAAAAAARSPLPERFDPLTTARANLSGPDINPSDFHRSIPIPRRRGTVVG